MKVIKRDGRAVEFNRKKIAIAVEKANTEVKYNDKATEKEIEEIIKYIEELDKKRILVEDIQDIIEQKLMDIKKFNLAKKYIVYRYTRALVRKQNTTDESILGIIKKANMQINNNENNALPIVVSMQRDLIAGEVSKDLTKRILLPEKISKLHEEGILYFHDAEYFLQPIINSCVVNIKDMLENGTVINNIKIDPPEDFISACVIITQIISAIASSQYGEQYIELKALGKYLQKSRDRIQKQLENNNITDAIINQLLQKELEQGIKIIVYGINTSITANGKNPSVTIIMKNEEKNNYSSEIAMINNELKKQMDNENITLKQPKFIIYENAQEKKIQNLFQNKFDQGKVSINLTKICEDAQNDEDKFWKLLDERLELCYEALMYRHYALLGTASDISPIHWRYGAISRLNQGEKIDSLLKNGNSTLTLGYIGIYGIANIILKQDCTDKEKQEFQKKIIKSLKNKIAKWKNETGINFIVEETKNVPNLN